MPGKIVGGCCVGWELSAGKQVVFQHTAFFPKSFEEHPSIRMIWLVNTGYTVLEFCLVSYHRAKFRQHFDSKKRVDSGKTVRMLH